MAFKFKTVPYAHQKSIFETIKDRPYYALFLEQGTGKTKIIIDNASELYTEDKLESVIILAPNGVHFNWVKNEIPTHCSVPHVSAAWVSTLTKKKQLELHTLSSGKVEALKFLAVNIEAIRTQKCVDYLEDFIRGNSPCMLVVDESTTIKSHKALQTKVAVLLGKEVAYRRILTGTPIANNPIDIWSQCHFLSPDALPYKSFTGFKAMFANEEQRNFGGRTFTEITGFKNLDLLQKQLRPFSSRIMKCDCLDLPKKIYQREYLELDKKQRIAYDNMKTRLVCQLEMENQQYGEVHVASVLSALRKLQQIVSGFIRDEQGTYYEISDSRISALEQIILRRLETDPEHKFIIWCVFKQDVRRISNALANRFGRTSYVSYYGDTVSTERMGNVDTFQGEAECHFFVANSAASRGLTLTSAGTAIYFANDHSLETRLQSEDRNHRIGQKQSPTYVDLVALDTVDEKILATLGNKESVANKVIGWKELFK